MNNNNRRNFIKNIGALGISIPFVAPISGFATETELLETENQNKVDNNLPQTISILQTTDVHCQIHPHDELFWEDNKAVFRKTGGYAYMATMLNDLKKKNPNTYIIDTGDMFQGSELSVKTTGEAFVPILDALKYDLYLPGNWEVIYGKKQMQSLLGKLNAPKICTNMYHDLGEGKKGELIFQPYQIWNVAGAKIGFLGYTDPLVPIRQSPVYSKGIIYTKPEENLAHYIDVLKNQENCSYIIMIAHLGLSQQIALANMPECEGVNYILGGDTHERVRKPIVCKYAKVVEPGAFGSFIGKLDLTVQNGKVTADNYELLEVASPKIKPDPTIQKLLNEKELVYKEHIDTVIGHSTIPLYRYFVVENPIDTMILNGLKWKFPEIDIVLSNGFRFCPPRTTPDQTGNIPITNGFIFDMLPVDSTIRTAKASGKQIKDWLEKELNNVFAKDASKRFGGWVVKFKGMEITFNAFGETGKRVQTVTVNGAPIDDSKLYSILACEREGDPVDMLCRMKGVVDPKNTTSTLHTVMIDYLKNNSPITPTPTKSAKALDAPDTLLTQVTGVDYVFK
ncbi:5'-nucleotidase C-terminal domain-containing protein [Flavobacterium sp.]|uniref:bifunctional metallophosphatase/5'-nucleotidase n=1 Tax=Flavobacterium sp. TaxID=239 RepID=UPI001B70E56D|nr:5'-nucleotidase C-terminal domain-containing protein [Flavobacterium sp.]MBP6126866.1 5'-nucleotidase C-terminal domain-containing protein [Flavobacterium sp.]